MEIDVTEIENQLWECIKFTTIFGWEEIFERIRQLLISMKEKLQLCTIKEFRTFIITGKTNNKNIWILRTLQ